MKALEIRSVYNPDTKSIRVGVLHGNGDPLWLLLTDVRTRTDIAVSRADAKRLHARLGTYLRETARVRK